MRIVLDTNILVRANPAVLPHGLARDLLLTIISSARDTLILSSGILDETRRVFQYPHVRKRWPLSDDVIAQYLTALEAVSIMVNLPKTAPSIVSDPDDDPIVQTAVLGRADILCTRDEAFHHPLVETYCHKHGIRVLRDTNLMQELRRAVG